MSVRERLLGGVGAAVVAALSWAPIPAQAEARSYPVELNIDGRATNLALQQLAEAFHFQIVTFSEDVAGKTSRPLRGRYTAEAALGQLLEGTDLHYRRIDDRTIAVGSPERISAAYRQPADAVRPARADPPPRAGAGFALDEVVVTARRREESLLSVPVAVSAMGQEKLEQNNIQSLGDIQSYVPSLQTFGPYRNTPIVSIRGQGGYTPGGIPSVVMYLNEVPAPTSAQAGSPGGALGGNGLFFDLESVQVLKGPQGTLFGRNTTGGAVLLQSRRPGGSFGGRLQAGIGNHNSREIDGALNIPLVADKLLARLAVNGQWRDGFTRTLASPHSPNGKDLDDANHFATRLSVTLRPSETLENLVIVDSMNSKSNGVSAILKAVNPNPASPVNRLFPNLGALLAQQQALGIRTQIPIDVEMFGSQNRWSVVDILTWEPLETLTLRNIASASRARYAQTIDGDGTMFPIFDPIVFQDIPYKTRQYTEELQAQGKSFGGLLDWTVGFFYLNQPAQDAFTRHGNTTLGASRILGFKQSESTKALFGQADTNLSSLVDGLSLTTGFRYTWETISRVNRDIRITGVCTSPAADADCVLQGRKDFSAPTWTVSLNYKPADDMLFYVASRRGFRSGGFNLAGDTPAADKTYNQEKVTDVEFGAKLDWSAGGINLRNSVALYRQFYSDIQLPQITVSTITGGPLTVTKNAGKAHITGLEAELRAFFSRAFQLGGHFSWTDYRFKRLNPGVAQPLIVSGVPRFKYGIDAAYTLPVDPAVGDISLTATWNWRDNVYLSPIIDPASPQPSYGLVTIGAAWRNIARYPIDLSFFMTNVANKEYAIGGLPLSGSVGTSTLTYGAPRMWGFRLAYRFGADQ